MLVPVFATPAIAVAGALGLIAGDGPLGWIALIAFAVGVIEGLVGVYFHLQGTNYLVGGLGSLRNFAAGPPPVLPLAYSLAGVAGLMGLLLHD
jgi:hypothetical protein